MKGQLVYACTDGEGPIEVVDEGTVRSLHFGTRARQSTMFLHNHSALALVYTRCMMTCLLFTETPESVLLLGLGGGSLVKFFRRHFDCRMVAVEKRPGVITVARQFFFLHDHPQTTIHQEDAVDFLSTARECYNLILVDLHESEGMAEAVGDRLFFSACKERLRSAGILSINLFSGDRGGLFERVKDNLETCFEDRVLYLPVARKRNCIALAFSEQLPESRIASLPGRAVELSLKLGIEFPGFLKELTKRNAGALAK